MQNQSRDTTRWLPVQQFRNMELMSAAFTSQVFRATFTKPMLLRSLKKRWTNFIVETASTAPAGLSAA